MTRDPKTIAPDALVDDALTLFEEHKITALFVVEEDGRGKKPVGVLHIHDCPPGAMNTVILIPARYASSRYPGKPLVELRGASGAAKPLIRRSVEAARRVPAFPACSWSPTTSGIAEACARLASA